MGNDDRSFRSFIAAVISILYFTNTINGLIGELLLVIAIILLLTSMMGFSPVYFLLKYDTKEKEEKLF